MSTRRQRIDALRAKAASTTFPAEAEALRAKADELEGLEPKKVIDAADRFTAQRGPVVYGSNSPLIRVNVGDVFNAAGGVRFEGTHFEGNKAHFIWVDEVNNYRRDESEGGWMTVTDIHGNTTRQRIW